MTRSDTELPIGPAVANKCVKWQNLKVLAGALPFLVKRFYVGLNP